MKPQGQRSTKHESTATVFNRETSQRSRSHAKQTPDGRFRCRACGQIFDSLTAQDAHHFREHVKQPQISYAGVPQ